MMRFFRLFFFALRASCALLLCLTAYHYRSRRAKPYDVAPPAHRKPSRARGIEGPRDASPRISSRPPTARRFAPYFYNEKRKTKNEKRQTRVTRRRAAFSFASRREGCPSSRGDALLCLLCHPSPPRLPRDPKVRRFRRKRPSRGFVSRAFPPNAAVSLRGSVRFLVSPLFLPAG